MPDVAERMSQAGERASTSGGTGWSQTAGGTGHGYAREHSEGTVARAIEQQTAKIPSDWFLWAALGCMGASLFLHLSGNKEDAQFIGQWPPCFLLLGLYNKVVKVAGSDRVTV